MTQSRLREYERLLRRLRMRVFEDDRIGPIIDKVKAHCAADWQARVDGHKAAANERLAFRTL